MSGRTNLLSGRIGKTAVSAATLALAAAATGHPSVNPSSAPLRLWWDGGPQPNSQFQIFLHQTPSSEPTISRSLPIGALQGLDPDRFRGPGPAGVAFRYNVEAGELSCAGNATFGRGAGQCEFHPSASYAAALARFGVAPRDRLEQLRLGMAQVTVEYAGAVLNSGLRNADAEDLKRLRNHQIEPADVSAAEDKTADAIIHDRKKDRWSRAKR